MSRSELVKLLQNMDWISLGSGSFNHAIKSKTSFTVAGHTSHWVLKYPHATEDELDVMSQPARAARKLQAINPQYPVFTIEGYRLKLTFNAIPADSDIHPGILYVYMANQSLMAASIHSDGALQRVTLDSIDNDHAIRRQFKTLKNKSKTESSHRLHLLPWQENKIFQALDCSRQALLFPYFGNQTAPDAAIEDSLIDIYRRTRNIVIDAASPGNFLMHQGRALLVDTDEALQRGSPATVAFLSDPENQAAIISYWSKLERPPYNKSNIVAILKTLLYMEQYLASSDLIDEYITPAVIKKLHIFRERRIPLDVPTMEMLLYIMDIHVTYHLPEDNITPELVIRLRKSCLDLDRKDMSWKQVILEELAPKAQHLESTSVTSFDDYIAQLSTEPGEMTNFLSEISPFLIM
ncbi:hypothetical protein Loa_01322 [Legionella oakridgensis ATCC 33761 = DSM 21215]|uniref:Uncharacterized protein n=1 Tax=Legionella oakridgensis ATCC 33761 = DSM 21215 TaxID=1268635 RepID=W0BAL2_9GAMM|nr:hypothetical protein [Legionella oakridgensis]AHE66875.1 hypothetical protein Loa_01322 [Legionella oakridgensis ATCC 33761 = DSM 21215]